MGQMGQHKKNPNRDKNDFYPTEPAFVEALLRNEQFHGTILEPCAGEGHISEVLISEGYDVISHDIKDYGYEPCESPIDFITATVKHDNIITNPPYKHGVAFVKHALKLARKKVAMLMKLNFAESQSRHPLFIKHPPTKIILISDRMGESQFAHAWFVWDNTQITFKGETRFVWERAK